MTEDSVITFTSLIDQLPHAPSKTSILKDLVTFLALKSRDEISYLSQNVSFNLIFDCLDGGEGRKEIELTCELLEKLLEAQDITALLGQYQNELFLGLQHPSDRVRHLCLKQIHLVLQADPNLLVLYIDVVHQLLNLMGQELEFASLASKCLLLFGSCTEGLDLLLSDNCFSSIQELLGKNATVRYRVYQLAVDLSMNSPATLLRWHSSGVLPRCTVDLEKDDILVQLNCIELLAELASCSHGLEYMEQQGAVVKLENMLKHAEQDQMASFLMPGLVRFFGFLGARYPEEICGRLADFMTTVLNCVTSSDLTLRVIALETIAFIGASTDGKNALIKLGVTKMAVVCRVFGEVLGGSGAAEYKSRAVEAATRLLTLPITKQLDELLSATQSWFTQFCHDPMKMLETLLKQPTLDLRCAAFRLLAAISQTSWGQKLVTDRAGFIEYLLDRSTETNAACQREKYETVRLLVESPSALSVLGSHTHIRLREFVNQGAFYSPAQANVAMEEGGD